MYTLNDLLSSQFVPWYTQLTDVPLDKEISYISVTELSIENFVRENELILTTAIGYTESDSVIKEFILGLCDSKACALIISVKDDALELPLGLCMQKITTSL